MESLFTLVYVNRQNAALLATRAVVVSTLPEGSAGKPAIEAFHKYADRMFPFMDRVGEKASLDHERLKEFVKYKAKVSIKDVIEAQAAAGHRLAARKMARLRPKPPPPHGRGR